MSVILAGQNKYGEGCLDQKRLAELWGEFEIISHFPKPGIAFVNPSSVFAKGSVRCEVQEGFNRLHDPKDYDLVLCAAIRGVGIGQSLADNGIKDLVIAAKPEQSKILPERAVHAKVPNEYKDDAVLVFDGKYIRAGQRVLIVDDLFATGGTAKGLIEAVEKKCGAVVVGVAVWTMLDYLGDTTKTGILCPVRALFHQKTVPILPEDTTLQKQIHCYL